jgi:hypothetical protein
MIISIFAKNLSNAGQKWGIFPFSFPKNPDTGVLS